MVILDDLRKHFDGGKVKAVDGISLRVGRGERFGLIGPDGAGKTTLFRLLTTLLLPDGGTASVNGFDIRRDYRRIRASVGYMPGRFSLYKDLTVAENLRFFATLFRTRPEDAYDLIRDVYAPLEPFRHRQAGKLSGGMKQKLALCCALVHRPEVLFLDEPTTGVDVVSRKEFWDTLDRLQASGLTTVVSTPYMDEADRCDRIALVQSGRLLAVDTPAGIIRAYPRELFAVWADDMSRLLADLRRHPSVATCFSFGETHHLSFHRADEPSRSAFLADLRRDHTNVGLTAIRPGIEDCFIQLMQ